MARPAQKQANTVFNESQGVANTAGGGAQATRATLSPLLEAEAKNPQGYAPGDLAEMNTAVGQSTGGATAAVKGEGMLDAARTGNRGGFQTALADSAREGERTNAAAGLEIQGKNADLRERNRQMGIAGLGSLYDTDSGNQLKALGLSDEATKTGIEAGNSGWFQNLMGFMNAASNVGRAASGLGMHV